LLKVVRHHVTIVEKNPTSRHFLAEFYETNVVSRVQFQFFFLLHGASISSTQYIACARGILIVIQHEHDTIETISNKKN
jgi:hypothetical protein